MNPTKSADSKPFAINIGPFSLSLLEKTEREESGSFLPIDITMRDDSKNGSPPKASSIDVEDSKISSEAEARTLEASVSPLSKIKSSSNVDSIQLLFASLAPPRKSSTSVRKASDVAKGIKTTVSAARSALNAMSSPNLNKEEIVSGEAVTSISPSVSFSGGVGYAERKDDAIPENPFDETSASIDIPVSLHYKVLSEPNLKLSDVKEFESNGDPALNTISSSPSFVYEKASPLPSAFTSLENNSQTEKRRCDPLPEDSALLTPQEENQCNNRSGTKETKKFGSKDSCESVVNRSVDNTSSSILTRFIVVSVGILIVAIVWKLQISSFALGTLSGLFTGLFSYHVYVLLTTRSKPFSLCTLPPLHELPPLRIPDYIAHDEDSKEVMLTTYMHYVEDSGSDWDLESRPLPTPSEQEFITSDSQRGYCSSHYIYRTWMQQALVQDYDPNKFQISQTASVLVTLQGSRLRIRRSRTRVNRVVLYDDLPLTEPDVQLYHTRTYNLLHAKILILPKGLAHKRQWNKRYPICIQFNAPANDNLRLSFMGSKKEDVGEDIWNPPRIFAHQPVTIYLFTRTMREKEYWFRLFQAASLGKPLVSSVSKLLKQSLAQINKPSGSLNTAAAGSPSGPGPSKETNPVPSSSPKPKTVSGQSNFPEEATLASYVKHMAKFMPAEYLLKDTRVPPGRLTYISCEPQYLWINALFGRLFWDVLREPFWMEQLKLKMQAKLKKLHKPIFIDDINVIDIELGHELPVLRRAFPPYLDAFGLWIDFDIGYSGGFSMSLETKMNAMKLRRAMNEEKALGGTNSHALRPNSATAPSDSNRTSTMYPKLSRFNKNSRSTSRLGKDQAEILPKEPANKSSGVLSDPEGSTQPPETEDKIGGLDYSNSNVKPKETPTLRRKGTAANNSDEEDSAESSTGSDVSEISGDEEDPPSGSVSKGRLWRLVEKFAKSSYLAKAMDNKLLRQGMEFVSRTSLVLQVDVQQLSGRMCINIPPPPSNRLWYGFRENPYIKLSAKPRVGDRTITFTRLVEWIEKKMLVEFQRVAVYPNMDDIVIPLLVDNNPRLVTR